MLRQLPNALTLLRLLLAPVIAWAVWTAHDAGQDAEDWAGLAAILFVVAALTDLFDGMLARALKAESRFGRIIDPIADKLLVGLPLLALAIIATRDAWPFWPVIAASAATIIVRDTGITLLRMNATDGEGVRVSQLAKYKTALELVAVGAAVAALGAYAIWTPAAPDTAQLQRVAGAWAALLALAAALSAWTGLQYLGFGSRRA